jgi:hypothetical protein
VTLGAATDALRAARAAESSVVLADAFVGGELSVTQAAEIAAVAEVAPDAEAELVALAGATSVAGLRDRCRDVRATVVDDQAWAQRLQATRRARPWSDPDGAWRADVRLAPEVGARVEQVWNAETERLVREARKAGVEEPWAAHAADALVALMCGETPRRKTPEVRILVDSGALDRGYALDDERCELVDGPRLPVSTVRNLLDDARVALLVRNGGEVSTITSPSPVIPRALRRKLEMTYRRCGVPGCANDQWLEIDHVIARHDGGLTVLTNLWRICPHHHRLKTHHGWRVTGTPGNWDLIPPDGAPTVEVRELVAHGPP